MRAYKHGIKYTKRRRQKGSAAPLAWVETTPRIVCLQSVKYKGEYPVWQSVQPGQETVVQTDSAVLQHNQGEEAAEEEEENVQEEEEFKEEKWESFI